MLAGRGSVVDVQHRRDERLPAASRRRSTTETSTPCDVSPPSSGVHVASRLAGSRLRLRHRRPVEAERLGRRRSTPTCTCDLHEPGCRRSPGRRPCPASGPMPAAWSPPAAVPAGRRRSGSACRPEEPSLQPASTRRAAATRRRRDGAAARPPTTHPATVTVRRHASGSCSNDARSCRRTSLLKTSIGGVSGRRSVRCRIRIWVCWLYSTSVTAQPSRPARAVRPERWR